MSTETLVAAAAAATTTGLPAQCTDAFGRARVDYKAIALLALPLMLNSGLQAIVSLTDTWFVGHISTSAIAAMGAVYWVVLLFLVLIGGVANLADEAAHWRRETVRRLFEALEHESEMLELLRDVTTEDLTVTIGAEHPHTGDWEASIVSAPFHAGSIALGAVGVVGPTAMDYVGVMASVRAVARRLSELATELDA